MSTDIDDKLAEKIAGLMRRLTSNYPNERATALEILGRTLQSAGPGVIHAVADRIQHPADKLSDDEMQAVFDAGVAQERKRAKHASRVNATFPPPKDMVLFCRARDDRLRPKERDFIGDMVERVFWREPTQRQEEWLRSIFLRLGGEMSV